MHLQNFVLVLSDMKLLKKNEYIDNNVLSFNNYTNQANNFQSSQMMGEHIFR